MAKQQHHHYQYLACATLLGVCIEWVLILLDISKSMNSLMRSLNGMETSRLKIAAEAVRRVAARRMLDRPGEQLGLVGFGGRAHVLLKLCSIRSFQESLEGVLRRIKPQPATNLGAGLQLAGNILLDGPATAYDGRLDDEPSRSFGEWLGQLLGQKPAPKPQGNASEASIMKRCLVISDGASNTGPSPIDVAGDLKQAGVVVDVIGVADSHDDDEFNEEELKTIASRDENGKPRYWFCQDVETFLESVEEATAYLVVGE